MFKNIKKNYFARKHRVGVMNSLEKLYFYHLHNLKLQKKILDFHFEKIKVRLADNTYYTPDFLVITESGIEFHETKGFMLDDANVKLKTAQEIFWFADFFLVTKEKKSFKIKKIGKDFNDKEILES